MASSTTIGAPLARTTTASFVMLGAILQNSMSLAHPYMQNFGINDKQQMVGRSSRGGFLYSNGKFTDIIAPGASPGEPSALGINVKGNVVGWYLLGTTVHGFLRDTHGRFTAIDVPGASVTEADGINDHGEIVGGFIGADQARHGYLRDSRGPVHDDRLPRRVRYQCLWRQQCRRHSRRFSGRHVARARLYCHGPGRGSRALEDLLRIRRGQFPRPCCVPFLTH